MKKIFLNEAEKQKIIADKEKVIMESFAKTYNKIKRIDENQINEYGLTDNISKMVKDYVISIESGNDSDGEKLKIKFKDDSEIFLIKKNNEVTVNLPVTDDNLANFFNRNLPSSNDDMQFIFGKLNQEATQNPKANEKGLKIDLSSEKYQNIFNKLSNK